MRTPLFVVGAVALCALAGAADTKIKVDTRGLQDHPFTTDFPAGGRLRMYLRSGEFHIVGGDENKITVRIGGRNAYKAEDVRVRLEGSDKTADLTISGGPKNDLEVTVEIPRKTALFVRMPAGDLDFRNVVGDKDAELHAGDLTIEVGDASDYSRVDASVYTGDLQASPFGEYHSGLFRSFHKEGNGRYYLHAHVGAGDLTLR
jgi:hypothetical protein